MVMLNSRGCAIQALVRGRHRRFGNRGALGPHLQDSGGDGGRPTPELRTTMVNGVHGKCGVVSSLTKFFDASTGSRVLAMSWPASRVTRSYAGL